MMEVLLERLKKHKPTALNVELRDGEERSVPVPKAGNRWSRVLKVIAALDWASVELVDAKGGVLDVLQAELDDDEEELGAAVDGREVALAKVMAGVMQSTMREVKGMFEAQMKGMGSLLEAMTEGTRQLMDTYQTAIRIREASAAVSGDSEGSPEVLEMMKLAFMLRGQSQPPPRMPPPAPRPPAPRPPPARTEPAKEES